jgi:hypothetical protein
MKNPLPPLPQIEGPPWREYGLLGLVLGAVFLACLKPMADPDTFWHLAVGREMWQTHALVRTEIFSFTDAGAPWTDFEWLFHALAYPLWVAGGDLAASLFTALCGVLAVAIGYRCTRLAGGGALSFSIFLLPVLPAYAERLRFRPDALSLVFFALLVEVLLRWRGRAFAPGPERWILPLLFLVWVQFHGGWAYGALLMAAFLSGALMDARKEGTSVRGLLRSVALPSAASAAALFLNPFGWDLPLLPLRHLMSFSDSGFVPIAEWGRTPFHGAYAWFTIAAAAALAAILLVRRRFRWTDFLPAAAQLSLGLYWVRYAAFAVLALAPSAASRLSLLPVRKTATRILCAAAVAGAVASIVVQASRLRQPYDLAARYPVQEGAFLRTHLSGANLFHEFRVGGYLEWAMPGAFRVFMDGRFPLFKQVAGDYYQAHRTPQAFLDFLARYPIDAVLYAYPEFQLTPATGGPPRGPSAVLFPKEKWALVKLGPFGMVLLRREASNEAVIRRFEYKALRPDDLPYLVWAAKRGAVAPSEFKAELERGLVDQPSAQIQAALGSALGALASPTP